ncbi:ABC-F family ATP-binding cassette domain-containing protein [Longirhabdus pacifica]|uniref:ABC-F family ATP-binding cassette domain-containing protein n=1 Tax=Longirhabdus pacifica TaxID=2305227 RepID=UPI001008B4A6|nr:ABC-F family ATP-binding cassette domain-containing protein [Longirhabdus pacifica]
MSILSVEHIKKSYGEKVLFDAISFAISAKQRIGLIGVNGTGKSSLLKVLAGQDSIEGGDIIHANQFHIEYLPQQPLFKQGETVLAHVYDGQSPVMGLIRAYEQAQQALESDPNDERKQTALYSAMQNIENADAWEVHTTAKMVLNRLGITKLNQAVSELSGGQQKKVAIARALIQPADLLLLDEPTNHLDNDTIAWLESYLAQYQGALMMVTHDRYFLNRVTSDIFELDQGKLYTYSGNYEVFLEKKAEREEIEAQQESKRQNVLRRELAWLRRGAKARTTKQKARIDRVHALQANAPSKANDNIEVVTGSSRLGKKVISLEHISKSYGEKKLIADLSYLIVPGERLGIIGRNGIGKSTLLHLLAGKTAPDEGNVIIGETVKIGYYTQQHDPIDEDMKVIEYIREQAEAITSSDGKKITAEQMLERFLFPRSMQWTLVRKCSGGERRRLHLLRILMSEPNVLFLDEPTNDLDIQTLMILEDYLENFPGVVITVSHDRYFLDRVVDQLLCFEGEGKITTFQGNYSTYMEQQKQIKQQEQKAKEAQSQQDNKVEKSSSRSKQVKMSYKEQQEWNEIEDVITNLEERIQALQQEIADAGSNSEMVNDRFLTLQEAEGQLEKVMDRWTELSLKIEEIEKK